MSNIPGLDGVRAISILMVMLSHSGFHFIPGVLGVTIFFFLSGFLITSLLLDEYDKHGTINIPEFYARRLLRLYPPLLVYIAIVLAGLLFLRKDVDPVGLAGVLFYFANYLYALQTHHLDAFGRSSVVIIGRGALLSVLPAIAAFAAWQAASPCNPFGGAMYLSPISKIISRVDDTSPLLSAIQHGRHGDAFRLHSVRLHDRNCHSSAAGCFPDPAWPRIPPLRYAQDCCCSPLNSFQASFSAKRSGSPCKIWPLFRWC